jgi:uncharacterized protein
MAISKEALKLLVSLQEQDKALDSILREIDAVPPKIEAVKADLANEKKAMDAAKAKTTELEKKKKNKELDAAAKEESARKRTGQLNELKSNDAYKAMQAEIAADKAAAGDIETEILVIMEEIDKAKAAEKAELAAYKKIEGEAAVDLQKLEAVMSEAKGRHAAAKAKRDEAAGPVPPEMMKVYNHIRGRGKLDAVVPVVDGHCGACQINLAPTVMVELTKVKNLVTCESCQRILYKPEPAAQAA